MKKVCSIVTALVMALTIFVVPNLGFSYAGNENEDEATTQPSSETVFAAEETDMGIEEQGPTKGDNDSIANIKISTDSSFTWISASWSIDVDEVTYDYEVKDQTPMSGVTDTSCKYTGLKPGTSFDITVKAYKDGEVIGEGTASVSTKSATVEKPSLTVTKSDATSITYNCTKIGDADGIAYKRGANTIGENTYRDNNASSGTGLTTFNGSNLVWKNLKPLTNYYLSIRAYKVVPADEIDGAKGEGVRTIVGTDIPVYNINGSGKDVIVSDYAEITKKTNTMERIEAKRYSRGYKYMYYDQNGVYRGDSYAMWNTIKNKKSKTKYLIALDTKRNNLVIYKGSKGKWKVYKHWVCACGQKGHRTPRGDFKIGKRKPKFNTGETEKMGVKRAKFTCWYATKFKGACFFHSTLYYLGSKSKHAAPYVGKHYSHGCVRLEIGNAKWLYKNCKKGTAVISRNYGNDCSYGNRYTYSNYLY